MKKRQVPTAYVEFTRQLLTGRRTKIKFDNFTSPWFNVENGIGQGDPISMILYLFYNADIFEIPRSPKEGMALGFIDDGAFFVAGKTFETNNNSLAEFMNQPGRAHEWSREHNSKFEVNKFNLVHFTQKKNISRNDPKKRVRKARPPLTLGGTTIQPSKSTKFLGVILDEELRWNEQAKYAVGRASKYALLFRRLTRQSTGLKQDFMG
jgi:hypothetical protein